MEKNTDTQNMRLDHSELWKKFSEDIEEHIREKGEKYDRFGTTDTMSNLFWIDSIRKYADEVKVYLETGNTHDIDIERNLYSIAHIAAILYKRCANLHTWT